MDKCDNTKAADASSAVDQATQNSYQEVQYWKMRYEKLKEDFDHLQEVNQNLEEKLLNVVETFEKRHQALLASVEYEKSTLMADVNKLSTKLVDARIKLHDLIEEKEQIASGKNPYNNLMQQSNANVIGTTNNNLIDPRNLYENKIDPQEAQQMANDPNLV
jgi:predicted nuclease with TOPRIM domain